MSTVREPIEQDTAQARKKAQILAMLKRMIDEVETEGWYGDFGVSFSAQNGKIGHYEQTIKRTYK